MQRGSPRGWTKEKERRFLEVLGETCNVTRACEAVGMSTNGAYKRRRKNAAFRAAWLETISAAYQRLELVLLDRAFNGTEKIIQRHDGTEDRMREYPNKLGLSLLKMHRHTAAETVREAPPEDADEVRERVIRKLLRLKERQKPE
jgi:aspartate aminotransferase-like enzyme